jgi:hypothetical protein
MPNEYENKTTDSRSVPANNRPGHLPNICQAPPNLLG